MKRRQPRKYPKIEWGFWGWHPRHWMFVALRDFYDEPVWACRFGPFGIAFYPWRSWSRKVEELELEIGRLRRQVLAYQKNQAR
jgi:hypothetical protein